MKPSKPALAALLLLLPVPAAADPFFVWGERTPSGAVSVNPYVLGTTDGWGSGTLYGFAGLATGFDVIVGAGAELDGGVVAAPVELMPRVFPFPDLELALAGHLLWTPGGSTTLGPEVHLTRWLTDSFGLWVNGGAQLDPAVSAVSGFVWTGLEVSGDVPFGALELDLDLDDAGAMAATLIPSAGVWLGAEGETGLSVGVLIPLEQAPLGAGLWMWRTFSLKK